jgi:hypothetical protein
MGGGQIKYTRQNACHNYGVTFSDFSEQAGFQASRAAEAELNISSHVVSVSRAKEYLGIAIRPTFQLQFLLNLMPADVRNAAASRRTFRKLSTEEEIEIRRARGEISCAECRRLKLKCDKKLPCGSCVRRGCSSVCPNGSLTTGQGTRSADLVHLYSTTLILSFRFVLADTEQLHQKIAEMGQRIRQLEDALAIFQSGVTNETHPLLREELLGIKFGPEVRNSGDPESPRDTVAESMDALGTLTIGDGGESTYFGRSAGSEVSVCHIARTRKLMNNLKRLCYWWDAFCG